MGCSLQKAQYLVRPKYAHTIYRFDSRERCGWPVSRVLSKAMPLDGHSSGRWITPALWQPTRIGEQELFRAMPTRSLFGLAPGGACHATPVAGGAVRSYRTVSPLPGPHAERSGRAVCSLWRYPSGCPGRVLPGAIAPSEPGLSSQRDRARARPSSHPHNTALDQWLRGVNAGAALCQSFSQSDLARTGRIPQSLRQKSQTQRLKQNISINIRIIACPHHR